MESSIAIKYAGICSLGIFICIQLINWVWKKKIDKDGIPAEIKWFMAFVGSVASMLFGYYVLKAFDTEQGIDLTMLSVFQIASSAGYYDFKAKIVPKIVETVEE